MILVPVAVILWLLYEWMEHTLVQCNTTVVESHKLPVNKELRLCLITDLHNNKKNLSKLVQRIGGFRPELILLAGDMVDKHKRLNPNAEAFLTELNRLEVPVYYSPGNHELSLREKYPDYFEDYLKRLPKQVHYLDNETVCFVSSSCIRLCVSGLSLPKPFYRKGKLFDKMEELPELVIPENDFHILMAHNPEYAKAYDKYQPDFIVSGHLHGGLLRLPFVGGMVSPRLRLPKGCDAGLMQLKNNSCMFVSRGLGSHTIPLRFFNRVEINFLVLKGTKE